jgi:hypothetical protein
MPTSIIDLSFRHSWQAEILTARPLILPQRQFVYPRQAEEVERGAMEVLVTPRNTGTFLATCALGFKDPAVPTGIWSTPHEDWLCAVSGGYAYMLNTTEPERFQQISYRPVLGVRPLFEQELLLFSSHHSLLAWGSSGISWQTERLSSEGVEILSITGNVLCGKGWDMITDRDLDFTIDLRTGERIEPAS